VRGLSGSSSMTPTVGGEETVLPMLQLAVHPQSRLKCKRVLYHIVWGCKCSLVLHPRVPNSRLQAVNADRVAPAERSRPQDSTAQLTRPTFYIAIPLPSFLPLSTPRQARLPSVHVSNPSPYRVVVLPHEAPSRVIALASVSPTVPSSPAQESVPWPTPLPSLPARLFMLLHHGKPHP
jgi:hypothetical protein